MGEFGEPTEAERDEALALAKQLLDALRRDEAVFPLSDRQTWLLAATLKHQHDAIRSYVESLRWETVH